MYGNSITTSAPSGISSIGLYPTAEKHEPSPSKFEQLSNHEFHRLLDKFSSITK